MLKENQEQQEMAKPVRKAVQLHQVSKVPRALKDSQASTGSQPAAGSSVLSGTTGAISKAHVADSSGGGS
jgi:hypothetical protein